MSAITIIMLAFSVIGAVDRIIGNRLGLGKEYEKGFMLLGNMALSMIGMLILSPLLATWLDPVLVAFYGFTGIDPGVIPASLFANDMGGASLSVAVAKDETLGRFNGLVVSSMMGCTVSYTIPYSLSVVDKKNHKGLFLGILCGLATIPVGCLFGGLMLGVPVLKLLWNMLPLFLFSGAVVLGLVLAPEITVKIFSWLGVGMRGLITIGLVLGGLEFLTGKEIVKGLADMESAAMICVNSAIVLSGAFPLMNLVSRLLAKPLDIMGKKLGVNKTAAMGLLSSLVTNTTTFEMVDRMDDKGIVINSAFAVSAAFVFGAHLAFTMAFDGTCVAAMMVGKVVAGLLALWLALVMYKRMISGGEKNDI